MSTEQEPTAATATKVVVSYPPDLGDSGPEFLEKGPSGGTSREPGAK